MSHEAARSLVWKRAALSRLAAGLAHEFNNVLQDIVSNAEVAADQLPSGSQARACADRIVEVAMQAADITERVLTIAGPPAEPASQTDLPALLEDLRSLLARTIGNGTVITLAVAADLPALCADPDVLLTVLIHLVMAAGHAMQRGGTVRIAAQASGDGVVIAVAGIGRPGGQALGESVPMAHEYAGAAGGHVQVLETQEAASQVELWLPVG